MDASALIVLAVVAVVGGGFAFVQARRRGRIPADASSTGGGKARRPSDARVARAVATRTVPPGRPTLPKADHPDASKSAATLDELLAQMEADIRGRRDLPVIRLRMKEELGRRCVAWSFPGTADSDLDIPKAEALLNERLRSIGMRLKGAGTLTSDDDGAVLMFWSAETVHDAVSTQFEEQIARLEELDNKAAVSEAGRLAHTRQFNLLLAWLKQGRYFGIPAAVLRECRDTNTAHVLIDLLRSGATNVRERAAYGLGPLGGVDAAQALCDTLSRASGDELTSVAGALARLASPESVGPLVEAIQRHSERHSLVSLVQATRRCGDDSRCFEALMTHLGRGGGETFNCLGALCDLRDPRAATAVRELLGRTRDPELVRVAQLYLTDHGGDARPPDDVPLFPSSVAQGLKFLRKHSKGKSTYEVYQAQTAAAAREFLTTKKADAPSYYIVVETPEGNWGIDIKGLYLESLLPWQSDLSLADLVGRAAEGLGSVDSAKAAALGYADNFIHGVICGRCASEWLDGLRINTQTVVRCPQCQAMNLITPPPRHFWTRE